MVHVGIVRGCKSEWSPGCGIKFHAFPSSILRRNEWLARVPIKSKFYNNAKICSLHFKLGDYEHTGKKLKQSATPYFYENAEEVMETDESIIPVPQSLLPHTSNDVLKYKENLITFAFVSSMVEPAMPSTSSSLCTITPPSFQRQDNYLHTLPSDDITRQENKRSLLRRILEISPNESASQDVENIAPMNRIHRSMQVNIKSNREKMLQKANRILMQKVKRQRKYIDNMKSLLATVKRYTSHSEIENIIKGNFADICKQFKNVKLHPKGINRGKLCFPSASAYNVVKYADKVFKRAVSMGHLSEPNIRNKLITAVLYHFTPIIPQIFKHPDTSSITCDELHESKIIRQITNSFIIIRMRSQLKNQTDQTLGT